MVGSRKYGNMAYIGDILGQKYDIRDPRIVLIRYK